MSDEEAIQGCNPESFTKHDFEVFGYEVDVKTSRDISAFHPANLLENTLDDDVMAFKKQLAVSALY